MGTIGKILLAVLIVAVIAFVAVQVWANNSVEGIEEYSYQVVEDYGDFQIREYAEANFIYATMDAESYERRSGDGFRILAGYIFGGNEAQQQIAMTSPVEMEMGEQMTMKFMVPAQYSLEELPKPKDTQVKFMREEARKMAAIRFSGFTNDAKIAEHKDKLFARLAEEGIEHTGNWSFMGYDPPYKMNDRRNEVVVEIE